MMGASDDEIVFLDEVLAPIEAQLGVCLAAVYADDLGELAYGHALLGRLEAEGERDPRNLVPSRSVALASADWAMLRGVEREHGIRLVAFHWDADTVVYGGDLLDEIVALQDSQG